jgi:GT2 family glycosyltransferase
LKPIGIIIVTYQSERHIGPLLRSLAATIDPAECTIWILDNASKDGTVAMIEAEKTLGLDLHLIRSAENVGFARGNNMAYAALQADLPCENIVLLNPDTVVHEGWWQPLLAELEDPAVGTAAPLLLLPDGTVNSRGNALHFLGIGFVQGYGEAVSELPAHPALFSGSGAAVAFRAARLEAMNTRLGTTGIFWELLYLYAEDTDLGWRMRLVGLENRLVPASRVTHDHAFRFGPEQAADDRLFWIERNRHLLLGANLKKPTALLLLPWMVASEVALDLGLWKLYPNRQRLRRELEQLKKSAALREYRRRIQAGRTASDHDILRAMTGSIRHGALPFRLVDKCIDAALRLSHQLFCLVVQW